MVIAAAPPRPSGHGAEATPTDDAATRATTDGHEVEAAQ
ncbi:hypothetical protein CU044_3875 [Streptomyces sp. L-9-10]|nr:hypothetical protein CU044_3875 [Streptomyces sp. L-9-10]